eukprot:6860582-Prymnesium_polylepis.1
MRARLQFVTCVTDSSPHPCMGGPPSPHVRRPHAACMGKRRDLETLSTRDGIVRNGTSRGCGIALSER